MTKTLSRVCLLCFFITGFFEAGAQRYLSDLDSSLFIRDSVRPLIRRFDNIRMSGYIQPQFQLAQADGIRSYSGGDFSTYSRSRFMLRRARVKIDYLLTTPDKFPKALFTFQVDATERGVNVRDMFVKLFETKHHNFSATMGLFARPFGYEVNLSSGFRESPERGRMSQVLMPVERDLGAMITFEPQYPTRKLSWLKIDAGIFNGPGLSGTTDFDSHKDLIGRLIVKPVRLKKLEIGGGLSLFEGGWRQQTKYVYRSATNVNGDKVFTVDSSLANIGAVAPRHYYGADMQVKWDHGWGATEIRAEYWMGEQSGTETSSVNPGTIPVTPVYRRHFNGAFFYFLQNIGSAKNLLLAKFDWYDPNTKVKGNDIGRPATNLGVADIRYSTLGIGVLHNFNENVKLILYYDIVKNETTLLDGYISDLKDNVLTCRLQFRF